MVEARIKIALRFIQKMSGKRKSLTERVVDKIDAAMKYLQRGSLRSQKISFQNGWAKWNPLMEGLRSKTEIVTKYFYKIKLNNMKSLQNISKQTELPNVRVKEDNRDYYKILLPKLNYTI